MYPGAFQPTVSVAIAVRDAAPYVAEMITSVLDQTEADLELVLFDNASRDHTPAIMRSFADPRIRLEGTGEPLGPVALRNRAAQLCRGELVKLMLDGDVLHPRCLERQVQPLLDDPGLALVAARRHVVDEQTRLLVPRRGLGGTTGLRTGSDVARKIARSRANLVGDPCAVTVRREHLAAVGGWRPGRGPLTDLDLWLRLLQHGDFLGLPEPLAAVRMAGPQDVPGYAARTRAEHEAIIGELADSPDLEARAVDRLVGGLLAPAGAVRRAALSFVAARSAHRHEKELARATS